MAQGGLSHRISRKLATSIREISKQKLFKRFHNQKLDKLQSLCLLWMTVQDFVVLLYPQPPI